MSQEAALARAVLLHGPLSRAALTTHLGLSPASLTRLARPLLDRGLLVELDEMSDGTIGRPSRPLDIAPTVGDFVGIKITGDRVYAVLTGVRADEMRYLESPVVRTDWRAVIDQLVETVAALNPSNLRGVGISLGGLTRGGLVVTAPFLGWRDVALAPLLGDRLGVPVTIDNDLVALAEAERWFGLGRGVSSFALITIGAGVGYALVIGGETVRTADSGVGTAGHTPLDPVGPLCPLGHRGCAEAMLTSGAIAAQVSAALRTNVTYDQALAMAVEGSPAARAVVDAAGDALGRLIALAANLTLQSTVILAGEGVPLYSLTEGRVRRAIAEGRAEQAEPVDIHVDTTGFAAWARGAAVVAIQTAIEDMIRRTESA